MSNVGDSGERQYYANREELEDDRLEGTGIFIELEQKTPDYIEMRVEFLK